MGYYDDLKKGKTTSKESSTSTRSEYSGGYYASLKNKEKSSEGKELEIDNLKEQQYKEQMANARLMEIESKKRKDGLDAVKAFTSKLSPQSNPLSMNMGPINQDTYNKQIELRNKNGTIGPDIPNNFALDDVMNAFQHNDAEAMKRLESSRWKDMTQAEQTQLRNMAFERNTELNRLNRDNSTIPILSNVEKGLFKLADTTKPIADIGKELYTPGAGLGVLQGATRGAEALVARAAPKLAGSALGRIGQVAASEALVGAPTAVGQTLTQNPEASGRELLKSAGLGAGGGALLGGLGKTVGEGIRGLRGFADNAAKGAVQGNLKSASDAILQNTPDLPQSVRRVVSKDAVPELFPERARRTFGSGDATLPSQVARTATQAMDEVAPPLEHSTPTVSTRGTRANYNTQVNYGNFGDEFNQGIANRDRTYPKDTNAAQIAEANRRVADLPQAEADFIANQSPDGNHIATGYRLLQELNRTGQTQRALNVADKLAADLTKMGQGTQAASIIKRLSPEGQLLHLQRTAKEAGREVSVEDAKLFTELAGDVQQGAHSGKDTVDFLTTLDKLKAGKEVSPEELAQAASILEDAKKFIKSGKESPQRLPKEMKDVRTRDKVVEFLNSAEEAALARIKARKNNLNALPLGEWADHAIVVSAQIARGTIKAATYVEDMVRLFGEEVRPHAKAIYNEARKQLGISSKSISQGKLDEAAASFERLRNSQTTTGRVAEKFIKESEIREGDVEKLRSLAKKLNDLKGKSAQEADMEMQAILNKYQKASNWDRIQAIRYIAMLFNTGTQLVNAGSGPLMATAHYAADMLGALIEQGLRAGTFGKYKPTTKAYAANPLKFIARYVKNAVVGGRAGARGVSPAGITGTGDIRGLTYKSLYNPLGLLERGLGAVSKGADYATYKTLYQGSLERQAAQAAINKGLKGAEKKAFVEKYLLDPPEEAMEIADRTGKNVTFQRQDRLGGKTAEAINKLPGYLEAPVKTIVPFVKTPLNMAESAVDLTPVGAIRGILSLAKKSASEADKRDAIQRLGLSLGGVGLSAIGYYLNQIGVITGNNESGDVNVDKLRESVGQGKYRLNTDALGRYFKAMLSGKGVEDAEKAAQYQEGDSQLDYNKFQPLALPIAAGVSISENKGKGVGAQGQAALEDSAASLFSMSALKGIQDAFQANPGSTGAEKVTAPVARIIESFLKGFSPSILAQETNRRDDVQRQVSYNEGILKDVKEYFMSRTPGLSTKLPAKVDVFGREIKKPSGLVGAYLNPYRSQVAPSTPEARKLSNLFDSTGDKNVIPKSLTKYVRGKDSTTGEVVSKDIPKELYNRLQRKVGDLQTEMINKIPDTLTPQQKAFLIDKIYEFTRKGATLVAKQQLGISVED